MTSRAAVALGAKSPLEIVDFEPMFTLVTDLIEINPGIEGMHPIESIRNVVVIKWDFGIFSSQKIKSCNPQLLRG